ncbi:phosphatase PAP2 family protein [Arthrobacter sp. B0490]|uniref:phosphatase PAP2 family protein n=1 Tax=Arthrobacter sp. B0490 TaxID=2058891 RepID=UPI000CE3105B|nr:phosphatase PAP2 family protein [Arthrobacter sp. B0490]
MTAPSSMRRLQGTDRLAAAVSEVFAPAVLVSLFLVVAAFYAAPWPGSLLLAAVAVCFTTALPLLGVIALVRRGRLVDHHISDRRQRGPVLAATLGSIGAGLALLILLDAPPVLLGAVLCTVAGVVLVLVVNLWWKLSAHSAVAVFVAVGTVGLFGPWASPLLLVPAVVGWSRVRLRAHTPAQVVAGYAVGAVIGGAFARLVAGG